MTEQEREIAIALCNCKYLPGSYEKRFARSMAGIAQYSPEKEITEKQRASLLVHGVKKIETRPGPTSWTIEKGVYLIHAASKWTKELGKLCLTEPFKSELEKLGYIDFAYEDHGTDFFKVKLPLGQIIGAVEITDCCRIYNHDCKSKYYGFINGKWQYIDVDSLEVAFGDYTPYRYAWICQNPRLLKNPIPYKGGQGYYQRYKGNKSLIEFI